MFKLDLQYIYVIALRQISALDSLISNKSLKAHPRELKNTFTGKQG